MENEINKSLRYFEVLVRRRSTALMFEGKNNELLEFDKNASGRIRGEPDRVSTT